METKHYVMGGAAAVVALGALYYLTSGSNDKEEVSKPDWAKDDQKPKDTGANESPFLDYSAPNLFSEATKNEDGTFKLKIIKKEVLTHDTYTIELEFPDSEWTAGLWPAAHFKFHAEINGEKVARMYSPVSPLNKKGSAVFAIKIYRNSAEFPKGGLFSQNLEKYNVGDFVTVSGPVGMIKYHGHGKFLFKGTPLEHQKKRVGLIAGGSGLTPMLSIAQAGLLAEDGVKFSMIYSNKECGDIMCKPELTQLQFAYPDNFKLSYTFTRHQKCGMNYSHANLGRVTWDMFQSCEIPPPADDVLILVCGPKGLGETTRAILKANGYEEGKHYF